MYCPNCGSADQHTDTFCRNCGNFLPDFDKLAKNRTTPREHLNANSVLGVMTAAVSAALSIMLFATYLGKDDTPLLIYLTAGFLTAMFFWQVQAVWRAILVKKALPDRGAGAGTPVSETVPAFRAAPTNPLLRDADPDAFVPPSVTDETTRRLAEKLPRRSTKTEN